MAVKQTKYDQADFRKVVGDLYASAAVTEDEVAAAKKNMELLEKEASSKLVALYKLEVQFGSKHHIDGTPTYGMLTVWENGTKLHGGGDALLYACPSKHLKVGTCEAIIPDAVNGRSVVVCPECLVAWKNEQLIGQTYYRLPINIWADVVYSWFLRLNMNADIRVKYFYQDIRKAADAEQNKEMRGEALERARSDSQRITRIYPLCNIVKDVTAGADTRNRILSFLKL